MEEKYPSIARQKAIQEILNSERISDQKTLVQLLKERYGIETNQAVISRDLRRLGVIKKQVNDEMIYETPTTDITVEILKLAILDIQYNEMMIVIKTHPGLAAFVGDYLDQFTDLEVLGSLAGENVVFVVPESIKKIKIIYQIICQKMHFKRV
jgi:transcriptional regulator of arginine metabolism